MIVLTCLLMHCFNYAQTDIDRKALVTRHTVINTRFDSLSSLSIGNGGFAFTVDITGLQSFPEAYTKGVPLGTQSEWGWHSFIDTANYSFEETLRDYQINGRNISYSVQLREPERKRNAVEWFRQNPHRLQLGHIGFDILKNNGSSASINDIKNVRQTLNMWTGEIHSQFTVDDIPVDVITYCHQDQDAIAAKVSSPLLAEGRIRIRFQFPYPTGNWTDRGGNFNNSEKHTSKIISLSNRDVLFQHLLDTTSYYLGISWKSNASVSQAADHYFQLVPESTSSFEFSFRFKENKSLSAVPTFDETAENSNKQWQEFWNSGAAVDFSGSTDKRAAELERRIVLSQWLTKIQCAGNYPPQETGLTYNSWFGRPHLEMHWWHGVHFSLWGRNQLMEKSLSWYKTVSEKARQIAKRQGYDGIRWQKMTDNEGNESPSSVGAFLIWQQPHFIYFAELCYRESKDLKTLEKYCDLVFSSADFMASYAYFDSTKQKFILGKGLIPAQEEFNPQETFNPAYELVYWYWALDIAQQWRKRMNLPPNPKWEDVMKRLSDLAVLDNKYLFAENAKDSYTNPKYKTDHPAVLGAWGIMPKTELVNEKIMRNTFDWIWDNWEWNETWGWDYPMLAMSATRLGLPEKAIDALLMPVQKNTYLINGHNYQDERLTIYLPGNGGLLAAVAMMCAGYDGAKIKNPGIPNNGKWKVRWEGLKLMP